MPTKIKQIAHKARSKSSLSLVQVLATALAAITMAFVSTRVTSAFNSFVAVGIISVLSALVAEFWRFTIRVGAESAQAIVVEPLLKISAEDPVEGVGVEATDDSVIIDTPEGSSPGDDPTSVEVAIGETEPAVPAPTNGKLLLRTLWRSTPVRLSLLFLLLGSLTVGVSYIVARSQGQPDTHVTYSPVQQLTEAEKQELLDAAALIAEQHAQETIDEANGGLPTPGVPTELPDHHRRAAGLDGQMATADRRVRDPAK